MQSAFVRGYVISDNELNLPDQCSDWQSSSIGGYSFYFHPLTKWARYSDPQGDHWAVFIGQAVDLESGVTSMPELAKRTCEILSQQDEQAAVEYLAYLGGRFICAFGRQDEVTVIPDCHATIAAFWTEKDGKFVASSHSRLTALIAGCDQSAKSAGIMESALYTDAGGKYYPGVLTPFDSVLPLIANCLLRNEKRQSTTRHSRFYPWEDVQPLGDTGVVLDAFARVLERHVELLTSLGRTNISLTAGLDSRAAAFAAVDQVQEGSYAYTYFRFEGAVSETVQDLMGASDWARELGLPHRIIRLHPYDPAADWVKMYVQSFPRGARFPALAQCYDENFSNEDISLVSTIAETGTAFYKLRESARPAPEVLAGKFSRSPIGKTEEMVEIFKEYVEYAEFTSERIHNLDWHDLFYWEHRNSKWASLWYSELDLSHRVFLPFNSRALIEIMLSLDYSLRESRFLLTEYCARKAEELGVSANLS